MEKEMMVKVCNKCGIVNSERAQECEACAAKLDEPVTSREAKKLTKQIEKRNKKIKDAITAEKFGGMEEDIPYIPVTPAHIVIGVIGCLTALCIVGISIVLGIMRPFDETTSLLLGNFGVLLMLVIPICICFFPSKMWAFRHGWYQLRYKEMPQPSDINSVFDLIACAVIILVGAAAFVVQLLLICGVL